MPPLTRVETYRIEVAPTPPQTPTCCACCLLRLLPAACCLLRLLPAACCACRAAAACCRMLRLPRCCRMLPPPLPQKQLPAAKNALPIYYLPKGPPSPPATSIR